MTPAAPRTAIVIVNWNTRALLLACLASVAAHAASAEVWVVDNASSDGSIEAVRERFPAVTVIANAENVGFAAANNQAIRASAAPFVWLLNSDTEIAEGALEALEAVLLARPDVAVVGAGLVNPDGSPQPCAFPFVTPTATWAEWLYLPARLARWRDRRFALGDRRAPGPIGWVLGASMLVRRAAIDQIGLLDEGYFMYSEEMDWCRRFWQAGYEVHLAPEARVMHHGGGSTRQLPERMLIELFRSRARYFKRHLSAPRLWLYAGLLLLGAALNSLFLTIKRLPAVGVGTQWAIVRASWQALLTSPASPRSDRLDGGRSIPLQHCWRGEIGEENWRGKNRSGSRAE